MPSVPAICESCGRISGSPSIHLSSRSQNITFQNLTTDCVWCGGSAHVVDGMYSVVNDAVHVLLQRPTEQLRELREAIKEARAANSSREQITAMLAADPAIAPLVARAPLAARDFRDWLIILLAVIEVMLAGWAVTHNNPSITVNKVYNQIIIQPPAPTERPESATRAQRPPEAGRNDPCPCGSGKKYKKCYGAPSTPH